MNNKNTNTDVLETMLKHVEFYYGQIKEEEMSFKRQFNNLLDNNLQDSTSKKIFENLMTTPANKWKAEVDKRFSSLEGVLYGLSLGLDALGIKGELFVNCHDQKRFELRRWAHDRLNQYLDDYKYKKRS